MQIYVMLGENLDQFTESRDVKSVDHVVQPSVPRDEFLLTVKRMKRSGYFRSTNFSRKMPSFY